MLVASQPRMKVKMLRLRQLDGATKPKQRFRKYFRPVIYCAFPGIYGLFCILLFSLSSLVPNIIIFFPLFSRLSRTSQVARENVCITNGTIFLVWLLEGKQRVNGGIRLYFKRDQMEGIALTNRIFGCCYFPHEISNGKQKKNRKENELERKMLIDCLFVRYIIHPLVFSWHFCFCRFWQ